MLGLNIEQWGGVQFEAFSKYNNAPSNTVWKPCRPDGAQFDMGPRGFMINFDVVDMDGAVAHLEKLGVPILGRKDDDPNGRFVWIQDPDGTRIELWEEGFTWKVWKSGTFSARHSGS